MLVVSGLVLGVPPAVVVAVVVAPAAAVVVAVVVVAAALSAVSVSSVKLTKDPPIALQDRA